MLHWIDIMIGIAFLLFQLFYAFVVICSLIENTGYTIYSIILGVCHAISPVAFVFFGYQCFWQKVIQYGLWKAIIGAVVCLIVCFGMVSLWDRIVLGDTPEIWKISLLTATQAAITVIFIYGFLYV